MKISLVRGRVPAICLPSRSTIERSSGVRSYFETSVGVQMTSLGPMRNEMLPPLPSTNWRIQSFLPMAQISFLTASASGVEKSFGLGAGRLAEGAAEEAGAEGGQLQEPWTISMPARERKSRAEGVRMAPAAMEMEPAPAAFAVS